MTSDLLDPERADLIERAREAFLTDSSYVIALAQHAATLRTRRDSRTGTPSDG